MSGHQGVHRTLERVIKSFWWPGVSNDVNLFCHSCDICQRTVSKGRISKVPLRKMPIIDTPFKRVAIDLVGEIFPASSRGHRYILTVVDYATRYPEAVPLKNISTITVAEALVSIFSRVGIPQEILSDQGTQFTSNLMKEVGRLFSSKQLTTTPYHPQSNVSVAPSRQCSNECVPRNPKIGTGTSTHSCSPIVRPTRKSKICSI